MLVHHEEANASTTSTSSSIYTSTTTTIASNNKTSQDQLSLSFYILPTPEITDWLLSNYTTEAEKYYEQALNEDQAELWIYRALTRHPSRTLNANQADVFVVCGCLHFYYHLRKTNKLRHSSNHETRLLLSQQNDARLQVAQQIRDSIMDPTKPHLLAIPTTNPGTSRYIGLRAIVKTMTKAGGINTQHLWSLGFERNSYWQAGLAANRILPVPYVVKLPPQMSYKNNNTSNNNNHSISKTPNFIFYAGDRRRHAQEWSGCDRSMVEPLMMEPNMDVRLTSDEPRHKRSSHNNNNNTNDGSIMTSSRLTQEEYNHRMHTSEYCLILCGDSPTSRSLTSAMIHGCIPIRIGSRLRGTCESPCHRGWGWTVSGSNYPHLPFSSTRIDWNVFPEVDEVQFSNNPAIVLQKEMKSLTVSQRDQLRRSMEWNREGFIYGWGNPVTSEHFGKAVPYVWESFVQSYKEEYLMEENE